MEENVRAQCSDLIESIHSQTKYYVSDKIDYLPRINQISHLNGEYLFSYSVLASQLVCRFSKGNRKNKITFTRSVFKGPQTSGFK